MASDQQPLHKADSPVFIEEKPKAECCNRYCCYKVFIIVYGFLFFIIGLILLGISVYLLNVKGEIEDVNNSVLIPAIIGLVVGIVMLISALCGIFGAIRENLVALRIFLAVIIIVFLLQVVCGIVAFVKREQTEHVLQDQLEFGIKAYHKKKGVRFAMDAIQNKFDCCGASGMNDWNKNEEYKCGAVNSTYKCSVPTSCCPKDRRDDDTCGRQARNTGIGVLKQAGFSSQGCYWYFREFVEGNLDMIGATALGFAILHILGCFFVYLFITKVEDRVYLFKYRQRYYPETY